MRPGTEIERDFNKAMSQRKDEFLAYPKAEAHAGSPARYKG